MELQQQYGQPSAPCKQKPQKYVMFDQDAFKNFKLQEIKKSDFSNQQIIDVWDSIKEKFESGHFGNYENLRVDLDRTDYESIYANNY
ncbi:MAG: hypothetical protein ACRC4G_01895 [Alphaproteobacteria bacterium]